MAKSVKTNTLSSTSEKYNTIRTDSLVHIWITAADVGKE